VAATPATLPTRLEADASGDARRLVALAKCGDHDAWDQLYRRIYSRLRAYATRRVSPDAVDDVVNETMTRAVAGIERFSWEPSGFDAWLFGIARRVAADHHRGSARVRRTNHRADLIDVVSNPGEALEIAEDHARVRAGFELLGPADRELLELRVIAGLTVEQAATVLGKRAGAVRTAQSRALARLRAIVEREP